MNFGPEETYLAQLLDQPAAQVRRVAVPLDAFEMGPMRQVYRAVMAATLAHETVTPEAVIAELTEAGRLQDVGGAPVVHRLSEHTGTVPAAGARVELVDHATKRVLAGASRAIDTAAREGRHREALDTMRAAQGLVNALQSTGGPVVLKTARQHMVNYVQSAAEGKRQVPQAEIPVLGRALAEPTMGALGLIYGFSQAGKSFLMQYLERQYARAGYPTLRISCEDPDAVNASRLISEACGIDASRPSDLRRDDWQRIVAGTGALEAAADIRYVVEHTASTEAIVQTIYTACAAAKIKVVFVDYAQLLRVANGRLSDTEETRLTAAAAMLKEAAKECGVMLWLGSQVTVRDPKPGKVYKPSPYDVKGGRSLYEKAEIALALWVAERGRFVEIQKDKISGCMGMQAMAAVGNGGVIHTLFPAPREQQQPAGLPYGSAPAPKDFQDA